MPVAAIECERVDDTSDELDALQELGVIRPGPRYAGSDLRDASGVLALGTDKPFAVVHGGGQIYFVTEVNGKIRSIGGSHHNGTRPVSERTYCAVHEHVGLLATLSREVAERALAAETVAERLRIVAASQLRPGSNAEKTLSRWGLSPQLGCYTTERVPGSLAHDDLGLLWVTWPDGASRCYDGKGDAPKAWTKADGTLKWRVVEIKMGLTDDECNSAAADAHASRPIRILQHGYVPPVMLVTTTSKPEPVPAMSDQGEKRLSDAGHTFDASLWRTADEIKKLIMDGPLLGHDRDGDLCCVWQNGDRRNYWLEMAETGTGYISPTGYTGHFGLFVIASGITPSQHAAVSAARGRRARIFAATTETVTSAAERFAAAVCTLAQDADALQVKHVMSWTRREVHAGTSAQDSRLTWLPFGYTHAAWGALQVEMSSTQPECIIRTLRRFTAHVRLIEFTTTCGGLADRLARTWLGDASPPDQRSTFTSVNGLVYSSARWADIFRRPAPSVTSRAGGSANLWCTSESTASMLRHGYDEGTDVARHAGNRTWRASSPTVIGAISVRDLFTHDEAYVDRLRTAWRVCATTECRKLRVAAWIPPYMPEVIEVIQ